MRGKDTSTGNERRAGEKESDRYGGRVGQERSREWRNCGWREEAWSKQGEEKECKGKVGLRNRTEKEQK